MEDKFIFRRYDEGLEPMVNIKPLGHQYRRKVKIGRNTRELSKFNKGKKSI